MPWVTGRIIGDGDIMIRKEKERRAQENDKQNTIIMKVHPDRLKRIENYNNEIILGTLSLFPPRY